MYLQKVSATKSLRYLLDKLNSLVTKEVFIYMPLTNGRNFSPPRLQGYTFRKSTIFGSFESKHLEKRPTKCKYTPIGYIVHKTTNRNYQFLWETCSLDTLRLLPGTQNTSNNINYCLLVNGSYLPFQTCHI